MTEPEAPKQVESFDVKKWIGSYGKPLSWFKDLNILFRLCLVVLIVYAIWSTFFHKNGQTQSTQIKIEKGGTLNLKQEQKSANKWFQPFIEGYGFAETGRTGVGAKGGVRITF